MLKTIVLLLLPAFAFAQQDDEWDVYMAQYEKGAGSTVINMSAKNTAPDKKFPFVLVTGVSFPGCSAEGLPAMEQFDDLYKISDTIENALKRTVGYRHVATFTYQCQRLDYFYINDTALIRDMLQKVYSKHFALYEPYINIKEDKVWEAYLDFLYPNKETQEYMRNQKVVLKLQEAGDKLEKPRKVDHWLYFNSEQDRDCMIAFVKEKNFTIEKKDKSDQFKMPYSLQISRIDKADLYNITVVTLELSKKAEECKGDYDGWETFVVQ